MRAIRLLVVVCVILAGCAATTGLPIGSGAPSGRPTAPGSPSTDPLLSMVLRDVRTDAEFTLAQLVAVRPVLVETMAIWCTKCRAQMHQVVEAHGLADFESVSVDVDPNERSADLANYADSEGFDWRFAVANGDLVRLLQDRFGTAVLNPPSMPKILVRTDGSVELIGLGEELSAAELAAALES